MIRPLRAAVLAAAFAAPFALPACNPEDAAEAKCSASASGKAMVEAVDALVTVSEQMNLSVATACRNIAIAGGATVEWSGSGQPTDAQVSATCDVAKATISAKIGRASCRERVLQVV